MEGACLREGQECLYGGQAVAPTAAPALASRHGRQRPLGHMGRHLCMMRPLPHPLPTHLHLPWAPAG